VNLGALGPEVRRLAAEIVEGDVELGLVQVGLEAVIGRVGADEAVDGAAERVLLIGGLGGDRVSGVLARVGHSLVADLTGDARLRAYAKLDRDLAADAVPAVPFATGTASYFLSARMGCQVLHPIFGLDLAALCVRRR
jgi:hypothetical protein